MLDLIGRGERIRTSDLTVPKSVTALLLLILTYYTMIFRRFSHGPFLRSLLRPDIECHSMREFDRMAHFRHKSPKQENHCSKDF